MASTNYITDRVQQALKAYVKTKGLAIASSSVFAGIERTQDDILQEPEGVVLPRIQIVCQTARNADPLGDGFLGNWIATAVIGVLHSFHDTNESTHHLQSGEVLDEFMWDDLAAQLTAALSDFTCWSVDILQQDWTIEDDTWLSSLMIDLHCCGADS